MVSLPLVQFEPEETVTAATPQPRRLWRTLGSLLLGSVLLSACSALSSTTGPTVTGTPAASISVALQVVGCTPGNICLAVGGPGASGVVDATSQERNAEGHWTSVTPPVGNELSFTGLSCFSGGCLLTGESNTTPELWQFSTTTSSFTPVTLGFAPEHVDALSCTSNADCSLLYADFSGNLELANASLSGPATWSHRILSRVASGGPVPTSTTSTTSTSSTTTTLASTSPTPTATTPATGLAMACTTSTCVVVTSSDHHTRIGTVTADIMTTSSTVNWQSVQSLSCERRSCTALVTTPSGQEVAHSNNLGRSWSTVATPTSLTSLSCATQTECVGVGGSTTTAWVGWIDGSTITAGTTNYVPSALIGVSCGLRSCAAIGVTTLVTVPLNSSAQPSTTQESWPTPV